MLPAATPALASASAITSACPFSPGAACQAVVVHRRTADDGIDVVAVGLRFPQPFEDHQSQAAAHDAAVGMGSEGPALTVGREDATFLILVPCPLGHIDGHPAGQDDVCLIGQQTLAGQVHGHQ
jgi:hypothetical protein